MRSLVNRVRNLVGGRPGTASAGGARRCVIDPGSGIKGRDRIPPGVQVKMLQRLGRFAEKEGLKVDVVLEGRDLRAVQHGGEFQGVGVFFAAAGDDIARVALKVFNDAARGTPAVLVTDDDELGRAARDTGGQAMRLTTFEKALDGGLRRGRGDGGGRSGGHGGARNRRRRRDDAPQMSKQGGSDRDPVRDMLDLVE